MVSCIYFLLLEWPLIPTFGRRVYFFIGVIILTCSLFIRSIGVIMALTRTNLSKKKNYFVL